MDRDIINFQPSQQNTTSAHNGPPAPVAPHPTDRSHLTMNAVDPHAPEKLFEKLRPLSNRCLSNSEWKEWCAQLDGWTEAFSKWSYERSKRSQPSPQSAWARRQRERNQENNNRGPPPSHPRNRAIGRKVALQKEYRSNPKRCMEKIREIPPPTRCSVPISEVTNYFRSKLSPTTTAPVTIPPPTPVWPNVTSADPLSLDFSDQEVSRTLKRLRNNSAPGPDRLRYSSWKNIDPKCEIVPTILNTCRKNGRIPPSWKESTTILIHKGDNPSCMDNWRPIALQNTIYKIYAAIIASRISNWAINGNVISLSQKGFLPYEGCLEHGFVLQSILQDSRRKKKSLNIAWLDLKDAFGSIPHTTLFKSLQMTGLHSQHYYRHLHQLSYLHQDQDQHNPKDPLWQRRKARMPTKPHLIQHRDGGSDQSH